MNFGATQKMHNVWENIIFVVLFGAALDLLILSTRLTHYKINNTPRFGASERCCDFSCTISLLYFRLSFLFWSSITTAVYVTIEVPLFLAFRVLYDTGPVVQLLPGCISFRLMLSRCGFSALHLWYISNSTGLNPVLLFGCLYHALSLPV
ncbi:hypothetical protein T12_10085 [Trichinella patagoniensis]|uniref:Uncharacterized protein n=1 Tax=Trichinella patagoniensis TaxID=990121 RepID=A0A0V0ZYV0_9BILA|nr:hypothetical protein T12_10085 [Trichinella patagoniensis]